MFNPCDVPGAANEVATYRDGPGPASRSVDFARQSESVTARAAAVADCVQRIRAEYFELPGLSLTARQVQRLWNTDSETCQLALDMMVRDTFLRRTVHRQYVRCDCCRSCEPCE